MSCWSQVAFWAQCCMWNGFVDWYLGSILHLYKTPSFLEATKVSQDWFPCCIMVLCPTFTLFGLIMIIFTLLLQGSPWIACILCLSYFSIETIISSPCFLKDWNVMHASLSLLYFIWNIIYSPLVIQEGLICTAFIFFPLYFIWDEKILVLWLFL